MPLPVKKPSETTDEFIVRCMNDNAIIREFPTKRQRAAVCYTQARR